VLLSESELKELQASTLRQAAVKYQSEVRSKFDGISRLLEQYPEVRVVVFVER
jgi:hypothetical protein